ncbi:hypothetical protein TSUD_293680 [Trifolium subterraneum]|uniref:Alpha-ketoglutarate-dependent dioxygenase AlkB-like domain-containing protein n=1 Tax=Trifolium subterraneum TaxID=3900 RepID=A0A2Z6PIG8_TRISU|nr:hypothetical protein TSUD_293680 [Trifolium subterraneum]
MHILTTFFFGYNIGLIFNTREIAVAAPLLTIKLRNGNTAAPVEVDVVGENQYLKKNDSEEDVVSVSQTKMKPFDICTPKQVGNLVTLKPPLFQKNREKRKEMKQESGKGIELRPGMVHLKGYISLNDQIKIVKVCRELGLGEGGFYQPGYEDGTKLHFKMMCLGRNWDPQTRQYGQQRPSDGSFPPQIPDELLTLVHSAIKDSHSLTKCSKSKPFPSISPDICIVNYYAENGRLGLHQAKFLYGDERDVGKAEKVLLESGDVLIFGGKSRKVFHGVAAIKKDTAPLRLYEETNLRKPGRLSLPFRQSILPFLVQESSKATAAGSHTKSHRFE